MTTIIIQSTLHLSFTPCHLQKPQIAPKPSMVGRPVQQRPPQETAAPDQPLLGETEDHVVEVVEAADAASKMANTTDGQIAEHGESPEKLSLKARLKLFEVTNIECSTFQL